MPRMIASMMDIYESFGFFIIAKISTVKPSKITIGATVILRVLKISSLKTFGSSEPPPAIRKKPIAMSAKPTSTRMCSLFRRRIDCFLLAIILIIELVCVKSNTAPAGGGKSWSQDPVKLLLKQCCCYKHVL